MEFHFIKLFVNPDGAAQNRRNTPKPLIELLIVELHYEWYRCRVLTRKKNAWNYVPYNLFFCFDTLILTVATLWDLSNHLFGAASSQLNQIDKNITQVLTCTFSSCAVHWGWVHTLFFFLSFSHNSSRKHSTDPFMERYACLAEDRSVYSLQTRFMIKRLLRVRAAVWSFELQPER